MRRPAPILALMLASAAAAPADQPTLEDVLRRVPDGARCVVVVPDVARLFREMGGFHRTARITDPVGIDDVFDAETRALLGEPVVDGPLAVMWDGDPNELLVVGGLQKPPTEENPLLEVRDGVFTLATAEHLADAGRKATGAFAGRYARAAAGVDARDHVIAYLDVTRWRDEVDDAFNLGEGFLAAGAISPQARPAIQALRPWWDGLRECVEEMEMVLYRQQSRDGGVWCQLRLSFRAGTATRGHLGRVRHERGDPLEGLRLEAPSAVFAWLASHEDPEASLFHALAAFGHRLVPPEHRAPDEGDLKRLGTATSFVLAASVGSAERLSIASILRAAQPEEYLAASERHNARVKDAFAAVGGAYRYTSQVSRGTAAGRDLRITDIDISGSDRELVGLLDILLGTRVTRTCTWFEGDRAISVQGAPQVAARRAEEFLSGQTRLLREDPRLAAALSRVSPHPDAFVLVDLTSFVAFGMEALPLADPNVPRFKPPTEASPMIVLALFLRPDAVEVEFFIPAGAIRDVIRGFTATMPQ